jgi:hypothetical protein
MRACMYVCVYVYQQYSHIPQVRIYMVTTHTDKLISFTVICIHVYDIIYMYLTMFLLILHREMCIWFLNTVYSVYYAKYYIKSRQMINPVHVCLANSKR